MSGAETGAIVTSPESVSKLVCSFPVPITNSVPLTPISAVTVLTLKRGFLRFLVNFFFGILNCPLPVNNAILLCSAFTSSTSKKEREDSCITSLLNFKIISALEFAPVCTWSPLRKGSLVPSLLMICTSSPRIIFTKPFFKVSSATCAETTVPKPKKRPLNKITLKRSFIFINYLIIKVKRVLKNHR